MEPMNTRKIKEKSKKSFGKTSFSKFSSIRIKLIAAFLVPIVFLMILGITSYENASNALAISYRESTFNSVVTARNYYELATNAVELRLTQLKSHESLKDYYAGTYKDNKVEELITLKEIKTYVSTTAFADNLVSNVGMFCKRGEPISTTGTFSTSGNELVKSYVQTEEGNKVKQERGGYVWTGRHDFLDQNIKQTLTPYAFSVSSAFLINGLTEIGYVVSDLSYDLVVEQLKSLEVGEDSIFLAITQDGYEISNRESEEIFVADTQFYQDAVESQDREGVIEVSFLGDNYLFSYAKVANTGIMVCGLVPHKYLTSKAEGIMVSTKVIILIAVVLALIIATIISKSMGQTIRSIISTMKKASNGDLTVSVVCNRGDEFKVLSDSANHMISNMRELIEKVNTVKDAVNESSYEVIVSADELMVATKNISNSIEEIRSGIVQQAEDSEKCLQQSDELSGKVHSMSNHIDHIEDLSTKSKEIIQNGLHSIQELKEKSLQTVQITSNIISDIDRLNEESNSIGSITNTINDIAEQTNLLSLNASIEAARAGAAGRGFSVVADEIRKLAEQSVKASSEIDALIRSIQDKTNQTVHTAIKSEEIVKSQAVALDSTIDIFHHINASIEVIIVQLGAITKGIQDVEVAESTTVGAIESISAVSEETAAASEEVDSAANRQISHVDKLTSITNDLKKESDALNEALSIFKL